MRRLKIALLSRWLWEENRRSGTTEGGAVQQLAEAVAALGHEVVVLSQSPQVDKLTKSKVGMLETWLSPRDVRRDLFTSFRDKLAKFALGHRKVYSDAIELQNFLSQRGPFDVVWSQCEEPDGLIAAMAERRGAKLPPTLTQIFALRYRFSGSAVRFTSRSALGLAFRQATRIIANSDLVAEQLAAYANPLLPLAQLRAKIRVLPHNLEAKFLAEAEAIAGTIPPEPNRILFFGALNEKKGVLVFMESLLKMKGDMRAKTFVIGGGFTEKNPGFLQQWNELLGRTRRYLTAGDIELLGKIPPRDVIGQIGRASVVVIPSLFDEFSRALVETLVLGRPVITTSRVGAAGLVTTHESGLVIAPNNATALAEAITLAMSPDAPYLAHAQKTAHRLLHEFSSHAIALKISEQLQEIAA